VVGGFLIALAALSVFVAQARVTAGPTTRFVVARQDLAVGSRISAGDLTLLAMELPSAVARNSAFTTKSRLVGATTLGPIRAGELVQAGAVVRKQSGADELEMSFNIDAARAVAGGLRPGERVDVLATFGAGSDTYTLAVVRGARVLATSRPARNFADARSSVVTLALRTSDEALALSHAVNAGEVTLVRSTGVAETEPAAGAPNIYRAPAANTATGGSR
jgi:Flp pilus assembly protein CpaB